MNAAVIALLLFYPNLISSEKPDAVATGEIVITPNVATPANDNAAKSLNHLFQ